MAAPDRPSTVARPPGAPPEGAPRPGARAAGPTDKSLPDLGKELIDLTVTYAKQETLDPLRSLGKQARNGVLGSALASVGLIFLLVGVLRLVQVEARLRGAWSFVPYVAALAVAAAVAGFCFKQIGGGRGR
jgi:hypothetical protein